MSSAHNIMSSTLIENLLLKPSGLSLRIDHVNTFYQSLCIGVDSLKMVCGMHVANVSDLWFTISQTVII